MHKTTTFFILFSLLAVPVLAQQSGGITSIYVIEAKHGMEQQYEDALKQHNEWHRQQNDDWTWQTWQYETGEQYGQYLIRTAGHQWEDFDAKSEFAELDRADAMATLWPYMESISSTLSRSLLAVSLLRDEPSSLVQVTNYYLHPDKVADFTYALQKGHDALVKANWPGRFLWTQRISGGETPLFSVVALLRSWADMTPPDKTLAQAMIEVLGPQEAGSIFSNFSGSIRSQDTHLLRYRPDLSYVPSGQ